MAATNAAADLDDRPDAGFVRNPLVRRLCLGTHCGEVCLACDAGRAFTENARQGLGGIAFPDRDWERGEMRALFKKKDLRRYAATYCKERCSRDSLTNSDERT